MNTLIYLLIYVMINLQTITYLDFLNISYVKREDRMGEGDKSDELVRRKGYYLRILSKKIDLN